MASCRSLMSRASPNVVEAASPAIAKAGVPTMIGGTDPSLTRIDNKWVFRARPNDLYSSKVIADFGAKTLKLKKWAIVHATANRVPFIPTSAGRLCS
jgi:branched-chain amino acid transport system substrate-binding protein